MSDALLELDEDILALYCVELLRIRAFKKYGLEYFDRIGTQLKAKKKVTVNKAEFENKLRMAKPSILTAYEKEKVRQRRYNVKHKQKRTGVITVDNETQTNPISIMSGLGAVECETQTDHDAELNQNLQKVQTQLDSLQRARARVDATTADLKTQKAEIKGKLAEKDEKIKTYQKKSHTLQKQLDTALHQLDMYQNPKRYEAMEIMRKRDQMLKQQTNPKGASTSASIASGRGS